MPHGRDIEAMQNQDSPNPFWSFSAEQAAAAVHTDLQGLSSQEAELRIKQFGYNTLKAKKHIGAFVLFFKQFNNPLIFILLFCAILSLILYDKTDASIILFIVITNGILTFFQEKSALGAMEKLLQLVQIQSSVIRNREKVDIPMHLVVPGDLVQLGAGDIIPGDCYLLESKDLFVDEATLTGESFCAEKSPGVLPADTALAKRTNALFMGTHVVSGTGKALVMQTAKNTEFGKITKKLANHAPETEFERGIRHFGYLLLRVTLVLLISIFALNLYLHYSLMQSLLFSLALAVGLTPQLLPAIISINLAKGARSMAKHKVIVKRQSSIEDFGSMDILCCDKTGTLTHGDIKLDQALDSAGSPNAQVKQFAILNAHFQTGYPNPIDKAILANAPQDLKPWSKLDEIPYTFDRKRLSLLLTDQSDCWIITKGAFQQILKVCTHAQTPEGSTVDIQSLSENLQKNYETYSNQGYRVVGVAYRKEKKVDSIHFDDEKQMTFLGFLLFSDTPKEHIFEHIEGLKKLGISLKIITGDSKLMAMHLAIILKQPQEKILTGEELRNLSSAALIQQVKDKEIFAEIEPNQKEQIILALKEAGHVVGFLGDGINDAPALHSADVSISVDTGADVTKEVADIVLLEKDLSVLQEGIKAGRVTFANTLKYVFMATSANFGNMFSMAGASLFLKFLPMLPKQILLINLMEDFPEMTIATDHVDEERVMKPLKWDISFIKKFMILFGLISSIFDYATFGLLLWLKASIEEFRTGWFVESVVSAAFIVLIVRTFRPFYKSKPSKSLSIAVLSIIAFTFILPFTPLAAPLGFTVLPLKLYLFILALLILYAFFVELAKKYFLRSLGNNTHS